MGLEWPVAAKSLTLEVRHLMLHAKLEWDRTKVIIHLIEFGKIKAVAMLSTTGDGLGETDIDHLHTLQNNLVLVEHLNQAERGRKRPWPWIKTPNTS